MPDIRTKDADLAAIKAQCELNYAVARHPRFSSNPIVIAALANAKASEAAFIAAVAEADAARGFRIWGAYRHVRQAGVAAGEAQSALRAAIEIAEEEVAQAKPGKQLAMTMPFEDGMAAYQRGDYANAVRLWHPLANRDHAGAQFYLGVMYEQGQGVPQDYAAALNWYRKAADQGDANAQLFLGVMYAQGRGVAQDYHTALSWFRKAADQGDASAQFNLGLTYAKGRGVPQDDCGELVSQGGRPGLRRCSIQSGVHA